jgi:thioredoxin reductase (NADPH)
MVLYQFCLESGTNKKPVLFSLDDDPGVLSAITRDLRRQYGDRYRILRADSGGRQL